jgi:ferredoxin-NADP reductase
MARSFHTVSVLSRSDAGDGLLSLEFAWTGEHASSHREHGQFVVVRAKETKDREAYFVLTNAPGAPRAGLLVRPSGPVGEALAAAATVEMSTAEGNGFGALPTDSPLLVVVTGSAVGAVHSLVRERVLAASQQTRKTAFTAVWVGHASAESPPAGEELTKWEASGVFVRRIAEPARVQEALSDAFLGEPPPRDLQVIVVGQAALAADIRALCIRFGLSPARSNF